MSHTKGKLHYQDESDAYTHIIRDENGRYIASAPQGFGGTNEADARRLVACWNALLPCSTEMIERYHALGIDNAYTEIAKLKRERDEALAALRFLRYETSPSMTSDYDSWRKRLDKIDAILDKHRLSPQEIMEELSKDEICGKYIVKLGPKPPE